MTWIDWLVPLILFGVCSHGALKGVDVYDAMIAGCKIGLETMLRILPPLIVLLTAVSMLRASGGLEILGEVASPILSLVGLPGELLPLMLVRPVSGTAALGVGSDLMATYGVDSYLGRVAAVMLGSTETTFFTIAIYFGSLGITKTRYAIPAALCADLAGFIGAVLAVNLFF